MLNALLQRDAMTDRIVETSRLLGLELSAETERALRTVPRHLFCEGAPLEKAYGDDAVVTNRDERGLPVSSVSAAWLQAAQIAQAGLKAGDRLLEIGSGGYNAALAREIVGDQGSVTSVDIDPAVTERALRCLTAAGYPDVEVIRMDAENEISGRTFDVIIVTVGAWDLSPAWRSQLAEGGRLVVPLRTMGVTRSWALERDGDALVSRSHVVCGFVPLRGEGANPGASIPLLDDPKVSLWFDEGEDVDPGTLRGALDQPRAEAWSGVTVAAREPFNDLDLWLAGTLPNYCRLVAAPEAFGTVVDLTRRHGVPAYVDDGTLAYLRRTRATDEQHTRFELGALAHGPDQGCAERAAQRLADQVTAWGTAGRPAPVLSAYPVGTPDDALPEGFILDKRHTRLAISWQQPIVTTP